MHTANPVLGHCFGCFLSPGDIAVGDLCRILARAQGGIQGAARPPAAWGPAEQKPERPNKQVSQKSPELAQKHYCLSERVRMAEYVTLELQLFGELSGKGSFQRICVSYAEFILFLCRWQVSPAFSKC